MFRVPNGQKSQAGLVRAPAPWRSMMLIRFASRLALSPWGGVEQQPSSRALIAGVLFSCLAAGLLLMPATVLAQQVTGSIVGAVKNATVTARDADRGTVLTTHTNDAGDFDFPTVPVGNYEVTAETQGFQ